MFTLVAAITTASISQAVATFVSGATLGAEACKSIKHLKD